MMKDKSWEDILADHAEGLRRGEQVSAESYLAAWPEQMAELAALMALAETLKRTLVPIKPSKAFRERLRSGLQLAAHHQTASYNSVPARLNAGRARKYWWVGAAALGASVAAGGIIAWVARSRMAQPQGS
jgi:hypothetical protein